MKREKMERAREIRGMAWAKTGLCILGEGKPNDAH